MRAAASQHAGDRESAVVAILRGAGLNAQWNDDPKAAIEVMPRVEAAA
jgi:hypothetical protein